MTDPSELWRQIQREASHEHAMCRYYAVTVSVIDALQSAHAAGRDLSGVIPGVDAISGAVIVAESLEADALLNASFGALFIKPFDDISDWALAVLAQILFDVIRETAGSARPIPDHLQRLEARTWAALEQTLDSPNASPLLWYEDIYFDVAQEYRMRRDPHALSIMKRGLAHSMHFNDGDNAERFLRDMAETHLWLGEFNQALPLYTALIRNEPDNIWHYNSIAWTFDRAGLARLGIEATERGLSLISATGDPERLQDQFRNSLARLEASTETDREQEIEPALLSDFRESLTVALDAGLGLPYPTLAHELVPDLRSIPVKGPAQMPTLPSPSRRGPNTAPERAQPPSPSQWLGRNAPCWCGSGKKYKHCHMRSDREGRLDQE
jgi:tetratricopeptide (TPR) repeat protein